MTLRTASLIAGVLGLILLAVGLVANWVKPDASATPTAQIDATVVVIPPEVIALSPDAVLTISGDGELAAHTARTQDVAAWTASRTSVEVTGISDWETLTTTKSEPEPSPSPTVSPTASPSPSATPASTKIPASPAASASASPGSSPNATASPTPSPAPTPLGSQDIWRATAQQANTYTVAAVDVPVGLTLVVESLGDAKVSSASLSLPRVVDDAWISQVLWWGVALAIVGLIALIALFIDVRPAQTKGEEWLAYRSGIGSGKADAKPGSRRSRRAHGAAVPVAEIPAEPTTGAIPKVVDEAPAEPVPLIALSGPVPPVPAELPDAAFEPPADDDAEENRS